MRFNILKLTIFSDYVIIAKTIKGDKMKKDVVIIGGGASGLFCALNLNKHLDTLIIEPMPLGKKFLVTGNGRCNLTNIDHANAYNKDLSSFFDKFNQFDTIKTFSDLGLLTYTDSEGRVYPISNSAVSVQTILQQKINTLDHISHLKDYATSICKGDGEYIITTASGEKVTSKYVVVAVGGGAKLDLPKDILVTPFTPALCGLVTTKNYGLNGVRVQNVNVSLYNKDIEVYRESGEILFKENGISGIVIMNISNHIKDFDSAMLKIDLLPSHTKSELVRFIKETIQKNDLLVSQILNGILHLSLANHILSKCGVQFNAKASTLNDDKITAIADMIKCYTLKVLGFLSNNQIFAGGVMLSDLNENLEHIAHANLFVVGEFTEVIGHCGGHNLQWAFTSGSIVGRAITERAK